MNHIPMTHRPRFRRRCRAARPSLEALEARRLLTTLGDFNADSQITGADADLICAEVASGNHAMAFDLDGDQLVDAADLDKFLSLGSVTGWRCRSQWQCRLLRLPLAGFWIWRPR